MSLAAYAQDKWARKGPLNYALLPLSWLYGAGWMVWCEGYRRGLAKQPHKRSLCVGNISAGGTGKTPVCLALTRKLTEMGYQVVISTSAYRSKHYEDTVLTPNGPLDPAEYGDESALIRWRLPDTPLIAGRRRVQAAEICHKHYPNAVLLMDDGFQHVQYKPGGSFVLDPDVPNTWCFPAGPYREPRWYGRKRADALIPGKFTLRRSPTMLTNSRGEPSNIKGDVDLLCAVGHPNSVIAGVRALGLNIVQQRILGDHDPLTDPAVLNGLGIERPLVVTAKDFVKLRAADLTGVTLVVADYEVVVEPEEALEKWLRLILNERVD